MVSLDGDVTGDVEVLSTEIDNHTDTICVGRNCRMEYYTPYECSVSPFLEEYQEQQNVKICTTLTAASILHTGETVILCLGQCLDFRDKLSKALLNPNQLCAYGINVCDNPTDEYRPLGIQLDDNTHLPLQMMGSIYGFMTWPLTDKELNSCHIFDSSDVHHWDPMNVTFHQQAGKRYSNVYSVVSQCSCLPANCYASCNDCILPSIESFCVSSTITSNRHHSPDAKTLSEKWDCRLEVAKAMLESTMQMNIRSAVAPLTHCYRTDLLSMNLCH
jgi:hypothetical protein